MPIRVMTYDIDSALHVSNIVYIRWLEDLRMKVLEENFPIENLVKQGISPVLSRTEIDYQKAIYLLDKPVGRMWMTDMGNLRFTLEAEILLGDEVAASARQEAFFFDVVNKRPVRIPGELVEKYQAYFIV